MSITRLNEFHARPESAAGLRAFLQSIIALIEEAPGCVSVTLLAEPLKGAYYQVI